jgi:hypothetical protein
MHMATQAVCSTCQRSLAVLFGQQFGIILCPLLGGFDVRQVFIMYGAVACCGMLWHATPLCILVHSPCVHFVRPLTLQEFDTIIVEGDSSREQLRFSRIPAPHDDAEEGGADDASSVSSTSSFNKQQKQQQLLNKQQQAAGQPIPVEIPGTIRHANSFGRMAAGSFGKPPAPAAAAAAGGGRSSKAAGSSSAGGGNLKYDPMASKKKGSKAEAGAQQQQQQQAGVPPAAPAVNGSSKPPAMQGYLNDPDIVPQLDGQGGSSNSLNELIAGLDANVSSHLDPHNMPAFLRTPERRDGQDSLPTQSW